MSNSNRTLDTSVKQATASIRRRSDGSTVSKTFASGAKITRINEKLAVELQEKLLLFINADRHRNFKPSNSSSLENVGAVVISRRFDLRYVCLLWHNIVHRLAHVGLHYYRNEGTFLLFNRCRDAPLAEHRNDTCALQCRVGKSASTKNKRAGQWYDLGACVQSISISMYNAETHDRSVLSALRNVTKGIEHPCDLSLNISERFEVLGSLVRDPAVDFAKLHPNLTLRRLDLDFMNFAGTGMTENQFASIIESASYCLSIGKQTLRHLSIQLSALDGLPEDWSCDSLQDLDLELTPMGYDLLPDWNAEQMLREFNKQANIPRLFPRLEKITIRSIEWPHIDFVAVSELAHLRKLTLYATLRKTAYMQLDWRLAVLSHVQTLHLRGCDGKLPMPLSEFVPNVRNLKMDGNYEGVCMDLISEIGAVRNNGLEHLEHLSFDFNVTWRSQEMPPPADVTALFVALCQLPALSSLEFRLRKDYAAEWCRPGDLALLRVLPPQLSRVSLFYCLVPAAVAPGGGKLSFVYDPNVANAAELIYRSWFLLVIHRLCDFTKLERFHCKILAPSFDAAVSLAAKWSKSSAAAIADLGLASVINVACSTDAYLNIEAGQTYRGSDTLKFRFTLASRLDLLNKKFATRIFTFELEFPTVI